MTIKYFFNLRQKSLFSPEIQPTFEKLSSRSYDKAVVYFHHMSELYKHGFGCCMEHNLFFHIKYIPTFTVETPTYYKILVDQLKNQNHPDLNRSCDCSNGELYPIFSHKALRILLESGYIYYIDIPEYIIQKYPHLIDWSQLYHDHYTHYHLSNETLEICANSGYINWYYISVYQRNLTEEFVIKYKDKINWTEMKFYANYWGHLIESWEPQVKFRSGVTIDVIYNSDGDEDYDGNTDNVE